MSVSSGNKINQVKVDSAILVSDSYQLSKSLAEKVMKKGSLKKTKAIFQIDSVFPLFKKETCYHPYFNMNTFEEKATQEGSYCFAPHDTVKNQFSVIIRLNKTTQRYCFKVARTEDEKVIVQQILSTGETAENTKPFIVIATNLAQNLKEDFIAGKMKIYKVQPVPFDYTAFNLKNLPNEVENLVNGMLTKNLSWLSKKNRNVWYARTQQIYEQLMAKIPNEYKEGPSEFIDQYTDYSSELYHGHIIPALRWLLKHACKMGDTKMLAEVLNKLNICRKMLVDTKRVILDISKSLNQALIIAASLSNDDQSVACLELLIKNGANVNAVDTYGGKSAFWCALEQENLKSLACLLENGAHYNYESSIDYIEKKYTSKEEHEKTKRVPIIQLLRYESWLDQTHHSSFLSQPNVLTLLTLKLEACKRVADELEKLLGKNLFDNYCYRKLSRNNPLESQEKLLQVPVVIESNNVEILIRLADVSNAIGKKRNEAKYYQDAHNFLEKASKLQKDILERDDVKLLQSSIEANIRPTPTYEKADEGPKIPVQ